MVAFQEHRVAAASAPDREVERRSRVRPAIDVIAKEDLDRAVWLAVGDIGVDDLKHLFEQVSAAMNVADCINPNAIRQFRPGLRSQSF